MEKKMKIYIVIVLKCCLFGSILGMDKSACITNQPPKFSTLKKLLQNGLISSGAIDDYIVPVLTLWQAFTKEVRLPGACLMKMKNMHRKAIKLINADNRQSLIKENIAMSSINVSQQRNKISNKLRDFCSRFIVITYQNSLKTPNSINARMEIKDFLYLPSTNKLVFKKLPPKMLTITTNYDSLQKTLKKEGFCVIELISKDNPSDWVRIVNCCKNFDKAS